MPTAPLHFDPTDPAVRADPFPLFARLRDEDPVHWSPMFKGWIVTRYADVQAVLNGPQMSADRITPFYAALPGQMQERVKELVQLLGQWLVFRDPPDHTRLRGVMMKPFTPKAMADIRPNIEAIVDLLLDNLSQKDEADIVADFTTPLPAYVIMDMLGVPRDMFEPMKAWSDDIRLFIGTARGVPNKYEKAQHGLREMSAWFRKLIAERRAEPRNDVLTALVQARDESSDGKGPLSDDELVSACILFLFGGHETTTNLLGNASLMLMRHPDQKRRFLADPALTAPAVEEFLRYDGPSFSMVRIVTQDHDLGGKTLTEGRPHLRHPEFRQPRRRRVRRSRPFRHRPHAQPPRHLRLRPALLHRRAARPHGGADRPAPPARPLSRDAARHRRSHWIDSMVMRGTTGLPVRLGRRA